MNKPWAALVFAAVTVAATEAQAEPPIGSRLGSRVEREELDRRDAALTSHAMVKCVVSLQEKLARAVLSASTEQQEERARDKLMFYLAGCVSFDKSSALAERRSLRVPPDLFRGMLAEHLIKRDRVQVDRLVTLPLQMAYARPWYPRTDRHVAVDEMATCVAETNPAGTLALLQTQPESAAERAAFSSLTSAMGPCLRAGAELKASRQAIRAALAEALYQRTQPWPEPATEVSEGAAK